MAGFGGSTGVSKGYVDGAIAQSTASIIRTSETFSDYNDVVNTGFYYAPGTPANRPGATTDNGNMIVVGTTSAFIHQIVFMGNSRIYVRRRNTYGSWSEWRKIDTVAL